MIGTILLLTGGVVGASVLNEMRKSGDTRVERGKDIFGNRYKIEDGVCFRCDGSGKVHGKTCRKCGGSGRYHKRTWYS